VPNFSRVGAASWLSRGDACAVERAADPLDRAGINAKPSGDLTDALGSRGRTWMRFDIPGWCRRIEALLMQEKIDAQGM
jgi:hypothetical protein